MFKSIRAVKLLPSALYVATVAVALTIGIGPAAALGGPYSVQEGSYQFLDRDEPLVATDRKVDLWSEVYRPSGFSGQTLPVVIFLHGNHGTCGTYDATLGVRVDSDTTYTYTGSCPAGYTVTPNHLGYSYLARELASWGYLVVSINANRGITGGYGTGDDAGLNLMRGRLVLRHLALLSDWNQGLGTIAPPASLGFDPRHTMDFTQVGLMGHSRGGEGVRGALQQYRDAGNPFAPLLPDLKIRSIFEIGPVDGQTSRVLDADGVNSMVLLPSCDGDVSDLEGLKVFDRVFLRTTVDPVQAFHGTVYVYGADHNAYNTEWLTADSQACAGTPALFPQAGTSSQQQATALATLVPFFRATVGTKANKSLASFFDPTSPLPTALSSITKADRGYLPVPPGSNAHLLETFSQPSGLSNQGVPTTASNVTVVHEKPAAMMTYLGQDVMPSEHDPRMNVANVSWTTSSPRGRYFQINFGGPNDFTRSKALSFRTGLRCYDSICTDPLTSKGEMSFGIQLVGPNGKLSNVFSTAAEVHIDRAVGSRTYPDNPDFDMLHKTLTTTVTLPLGAFRGVDLSQVAAVRFLFDDQPEGSVDISDLALLDVTPFPTAPMSVAGTTMPTQQTVTRVSMQLAQAEPTAAQDGNTIQVVGTTATAAKTMTMSAQSKVASQKSVTIVLNTKRKFPVTDAFPTLNVDGVSLKVPAQRNADGTAMTITMPQAIYERLPAGAPVSLQTLASQPAWQFGALPK